MAKSPARIERPDQSDLSDEQKRCCRVLSGVMRGWHHCGKVWTWGNGIKTSLYGSISTYDSDILTRLVLAAHVECVRVDVCASGPRMVGVRLSPRKARTGDLWDRHPDVSTALAAFLKGWGEPDFKERAEAATEQHT